jgi:tetratricopeptide (TPR) repeat protein
MVRKYIIILSIILISGCSLFQDNIAEGWKAFENGDYEKARDCFSKETILNANLEAYVGLGWSNAKLGNKESALSSFEYVILEDSINYIDAISGAVFAGSAMCMDSTSAIRGTYFLSKYPNYVFEHDTKVTFKQVAFTSACSYVNIGDFSSALLMIKIIEPGFNAIPGNEQGKLDILLKIEEISQWI